MILNAEFKMKNQNLKAGKAESAERFSENFSEDFAGKSPKKIFCRQIFYKFYKIEKTAFSVLFSLVFLLSFSVFAKDNSLKKKSSSEKESSKTATSESTKSESTKSESSENSESTESKIPESDFQNSLLNSENDSALDSELLEIQAELDSAVEIRSSESVAQILKNSKNQENYPQIENLVLEKARNLVLTEDFELAKNISLCVIEMNIENFEAIDLYSFIEKTIANERAYKRSQILKRNRELKGAGHEIY